MSNVQRRDVGRIVFASDKEWIILTLKSHVDNVATLAKHWDHTRAYLGQIPIAPEKTHTKLVRAAEIHDDAKPSHFRLVYKAKERQWEYSFAGHRFAVDYPSDPYIESLVHLHHEYSVEGITTAIANLRNRSDDFPNLALKEIAAQFPLDLYALEMADQIEATVARASVESVDPESRVFMDFQFRTEDAGKAIYCIDPFPFLSQEVQLEIEYMTWHPPVDLLNAVVNANPENQRRAVDNLRRALESAIQELPLSYKRAHLRPWFEKEQSTPRHLTSIADMYKQLTGYSTPNPMQETTWSAITQDTETGIGVLVKSLTGTGKTEAVTIPAMATNRRLIMVYPTRSLVDDQISRMSRLLERLSIYSGKPVSLCVDTGAESLRRVWENGKERVATGNIHRHLYHADVIVTTLDKFLYRYFGFGEKQKSYIFPLRIHHGVKPTLICFDEAHSYDDVALTNFSRLVRSLYEQGRDIVLMTATMPSQKERQFFDYLDVIDYVHDPMNLANMHKFLETHFPDRCYPERTLTLAPAEISPDDENRRLIAAFQEEILTRSALNQRLIAVIERVQDAVAVWENIRTSVSPITPIYLYHGRLTHKQRQKVYQDLVTQEEENKGYILITTSAIEVGCDLDAHTLISQLCDPDRLVQRAGRCNRKQKIPNAQLVVIGSQIPQWLTSLSEGDWNRYWKHLQSTDKGIFNPQQVMSCLQEQTHRLDYRVEMMFDMLHEYLYNAKIENRPLHEKGIIITRSWEPSITIGSGRGQRDELYDAIEVPLRSCRLQEGEILDRDWHVAKRVYNDQVQRYEEMPLSGWECAYSVDLIAYDCSTLSMFDEEVGWVNVPRLFNSGFTQGYRRVLVRELDDLTHRLWYIADIKEAEAAPVSTVEQESESDDIDEESD